MDNKPTWLRILLDTIGFQTLLAVIVGVPAMIAFISSIWGALSNGHRISAIVAGGILLAAIVLFIYSRVKKVLYIIPTLLRKMHERTMILASSLDADDLSTEDIEKFMSLTGVDTAQLQSLKPLIKDIASFIDSVPKLIEIGKEGAEKMIGDMDATWRIQYFMFETSGLKQSLIQDKAYKKLKEQLDKIPIPNTEIAQSIIDYENASHIIGTWLPILRAPAQNGKLETLFPLPYKLDSKVKVEELSNQMKLLLSRVSEAIDKYYKGK